MEPLIVKDVSLWMAFLHGVLAFLNPCILPLIPFFLSVLFEKRGFSRFFRFSLGFCGTFTGLGFLFSCFTTFSNRVVLGKTMGVVIITLSVLYALEYRFPVFGNVVQTALEWSGSSAVFGVILAAAWIPCSSPVIVSALALMSECGGVLKGILMMLLFSLGILIPFLIFGRWISGLFENLSKTLKKSMRYSIAFLMILSGIWFLLS